MREKILSLWDLRVYQTASRSNRIETAFACGYINVQVKNGLMEQCQEIGRMLGMMMAAPEKFSRTQPSSVV